MAGAAGVPTSYATSFDAFFLVDGDGVIRYRRTSADGYPAWRPAEIGPVVDTLLAELVSGAEDVPSGQGFHLDAAYPNPFNPSTRIPYRLHGERDDVAVRLAILDLKGRTVRTLVAERQATGQDYDVLWDGRDDAGRRMPSGTYMVSLTVAEDTRARFLTLIK